MLWFVGIVQLLLFIPRGRGAASGGEAGAAEGLVWQGVGNGCSVRNWGRRWHLLYLLPIPQPASP